MMLTTEKPWRKNHALGIRIKDIYCNFNDFAWAYCCGIIFTENEILEYPLSAIKTLIRMKKGNAIQALIEVHEEDIRLCAGVE